MYIVDNFDLSTVLGSLDNLDWFLKVDSIYLHYKLGKMWGKMATKSFTTEFKFNSKSAKVLANALDKDKPKKMQKTKPITKVVSEERLKSIVESFKG